MLGHLETFHELNEAMQHAHLFVDVKERVTRQEETETRIQEKGK